MNNNNDFQSSRLPQPIDNDNYGLMQLPKSIKLQESGEVFS